MVSTLTPTPSAVANQGHATSLSGNRYALMIVGSEASPSARILKVIAMSPTFVISHNANPTADSTPHNRSNFVSFHSAFLLVSDASKVSTGNKPMLKVWIASNPAPCDTSATAETIGAIDHIK